MTKDEALKLALHGLEMGLPLIEDFGSKEQLNTQHKAIAAIYEVYEKAKQNSVIGVQYVQGIPFFPPPQRTWVGLMRGVRVEGNAVVITVKGGNDEARALCGELINEMEKNT